MATTLRQRNSLSSARKSTAKRGTGKKAPGKNSAGKKAAASIPKVASLKGGNKAKSARTGMANAMNRSGSARVAKTAARKSKAGTGTSAGVGAPAKPRPGDLRATAKSPAKKSTTKKSTGESRSKRPSTVREPEVDVLAQQAAARQSRESAAKQESRGTAKVEADDRKSRSAGRHSGVSDADYVTEKGDARRRDPDVNKNSQAQKDDVRDGQRDQDPHPKRRSEGGRLQDGGARQAQVSRSRPPQTTGPARK